MATKTSTYRELVMTLKEICELHPAIETFRIGPISSVEVPDNALPEVKYPYVHLIPQPATMEQSVTQFDFDFIIMDLVDLANLELQVRQQSQMLEIARDVIAKFVMTNYGSVRFKINFPITATPFVERFLNDVSGWTLQITVQALTPMNDCTNPIVLT